MTGRTPTRGGRESAYQPSSFRGALEIHQRRIYFQGSTQTACICFVLVGNFASIKNRATRLSSLLPACIVWSPSFSIPTQYSGVRFLATPDELMGSCTAAVAFNRMSSARKNRQAACSPRLCWLGPVPLWLFCNNTSMTSTPCKRAALQKFPEKRAAQCEH